MLKIKQILLSFLFGLLFIAVIVLVSTGGFVIRNLYDTNNESSSTIQEKTPLTTYENDKYSITYPEDYQLQVDRILSTDGFEDEQEDTIQLISPTLPNTNGDLSIIITFEPLNVSNEDDGQGTTCPELFDKKLDPISIGENTFTHSGLVNCGPTQAAFFYVINNGNIYEAKVETSANYEKEAFPEVIKILETIKFFDE